MAPKGKTAPSKAQPKAKAKATKPKRAAKADTLDAKPARKPAKKKAARPVDKKTRTGRIAARAAATQRARKAAD